MTSRRDVLKGLMVGAAALVQQPLPLPKPKRPSRTDALESYISARLGQWIDVIDMARITGVSGVRERRREVEQRLGKPERREWTDPEGLTHLEFRWQRRERAA